MAEDVQAPASKRPKDLYLWTRDTPSRTTYSDLFNDAVTANPGGIQPKDILAWLESNRPETCQGRSKEKLKAAIYSTLRYEVCKSKPRIRRSYEPGAGYTYKPAPIGKVARTVERSTEPPLRKEAPKLLLENLSDTSALLSALGTPEARVHSAANDNDRTEQVQTMRLSGPQATSTRSPAGDRNGLGSEVHLQRHNARPGSVTHAKENLAMSAKTVPSTTTNVPRMRLNNSVAESVTRRAALVLRSETSRTAVAYSGKQDNGGRKTSLSAGRRSLAAEYDKIVIGVVHNLRRLSSKRKIYEEEKKERVLALQSIEGQICQRERRNEEAQAVLLIKKQDAKHADDRARQTGEHEQDRCKLARSARELAPSGIVWANAQLKIAHELHAAARNVADNMRVQVGIAGRDAGCAYNNVKDVYAEKICMKVAISFVDEEIAKVKQEEIAGWESIGFPRRSLYAEK